MIIDIPDIDVLQAGVTKIRTQECQDEYKITPPINLDKFIFTRNTRPTSKHSLEYKKLYTTRGKVYYENSSGGHWIYPTAMSMLFANVFGYPTKVVIHKLPCGDTDWSYLFGGWSGRYLTHFEVLCSTSQVTNLDNTWNSCDRLTSFPLIDTSNVTSMNSTWYGCNGLTSFPLIDTSSVTSLYLTWGWCTRLISFPLINTSKVTNMYVSWGACKSLTSFPLIDTSQVTDMYATWGNCELLPSFPLIDTSNVTYMDRTWSNCFKLTSFPLIDTSKVINMLAPWGSCVSISSFPHIDTSNAIQIWAPWYECPLPTKYFPDEFMSRQLFSDGSPVPDNRG